MSVCLQSIALIWQTRPCNERCFGVRMPTVNRVDLADASLQCINARCSGVYMPTVNRVNLADASLHGATVHLYNFSITATPQRDAAGYSYGPPEGT